MFGHDDVAVDLHPEAAVHLLDGQDEEPVHFVGNKSRLPAVTTEGRKVSLSGALQALEAAGHAESYASVSTQVSAQRLARNPSTSSGQALGYPAARR